MALETIRPNHRHTSKDAHPVRQYVPNCHNQPDETRAVLAGGDKI